MNRTLPLLLTLLLAATAGARRIADFFVLAPMYEAAPYIDANMRMDMLDYFRSGLPSKTTNMFDEPVAIVSETPASLQLNAGKGVEMQYAMAVSGPDTLLVVIETLPTPMPDSKVSIFDTGWKTRPHTAPAPGLADWLTPEGMANRARVEEILPFITASAEFVEDGNRLVYTQTIGSYFSANDSISAEVARYLKPQLIYMFDGKNFRPAR